MLAHVVAFSIRRLPARGRLCFQKQSDSVAVLIPKRMAGIARAILLFLLVFVVVLTWWPLPFFCIALLGVATVPGPVTMTL